MSLCGDDDARCAERSATIDTALLAPVRLCHAIVQAVARLPRPS